MVGIHPPGMGICFVKCNYHDSLQARLREGTDHSRTVNEVKFSSCTNLRREQKARSLGISLWVLTYLHRISVSDGSIYR